MMEPEARIAALKVALVAAYDIVREAFEAAHIESGNDSPLFMAAFGHVLTALIQDINDAEAAR